MGSGRRIAATLNRVGYLHLPGGGQIVVDGRYGYVGHMAPPHGTTILDLAEPAHPRVIAQVSVPGDIHSH
ncbi:MAG: RNA polymerase subunit sigma-70, partial [Bacillati bacterium ANGP1]